MDFRADKGGENFQVASSMLEHPLRGPGKGSFISGRSAVADPGVQRNPPFCPTL